MRFRSSINPGPVGFHPSAWRLVDILIAGVRVSTKFPASVPAVDLVSEFTPFSDAGDRARWLACHKEFAAAAPNREAIVAYGCGHYIYRENPPLVVESIVKMYSRVLTERRRGPVLERGLAYAVAATNESRRREAAPGNK